MHKSPATLNTRGKVLGNQSYRYIATLIIYYLSAARPNEIAVLRCCQRHRCIGRQRAEEQNNGHVTAGYSASIHHTDSSDAIRGEQLQYVLCRLEHAMLTKALEQLSCDSYRRWHCPHFVVLINRKQGPG